MSGCHGGEGRGTPALQLTVYSDFTAYLGMDPTKIPQESLPTLLRELAAALEGTNGATVLMFGQLPN